MIYRGWLFVPLVFSLSACHLLLNYREPIDVPSSEIGEPSLEFPTQNSCAFSQEGATLFQRGDGAACFAPINNFSATNYAVKTTLVFSSFSPIGSIHPGAGVGLRLQNYSTLTADQHPPMYSCGIGFNPKDTAPIPYLVIAKCPDANAACALKQSMALSWAGLSTKFTIETKVVGNTISCQISSNGANLTFLEYLDTDSVQFLSGPPALISTYAQGEFTEWSVTPL